MSAATERRASGTGAATGPVRHAGRAVRTLATIGLLEATLPLNLALVALVLGVGTLGKLAGTPLGARLTGTAVFGVVQAPVTGMRCRSRPAASSSSAVRMSRVSSCSDCSM